jgi:type IV pilus assembly protein PilC
MIGVGVLMTTVILPKLIEIFDEFDAELPIATRILIAVVHFVSNPLYFALTVLSLAGLVTLFIYSLKKSYSFRKFVHAVNLKLPIFGGVIKQINLARFSMTLSSLLKSTIPIIDAVDITADTCTNIAFQESLHATAKSLKSGQPVSDVLRQYNHLFPPMVTEMIMVGERSGEIEHLLNELSDFYNAEVDKTMKNFTAIIEPLLIVMLGLAVAGVAVAVIMPMYSLAQNF